MVLLNWQTSFHRNQRILGNVWITKSNSLRRTAKEKEKTCKYLEDKIVNVAGELKNAKNVLEDP